MLRLDLGLHFLCLSLILLKRGACRDWFVSPSKGLNDEYCGTETHPCQTYTYVIQTKWVEGGLSVLLECGHNNTYYECVLDRPNGQPGGVAITFPPQGSSLHMSTWGNCSEDHAYIDCQKQGSAFWFYSPPEYGSTVVLKNIVFVNGSTAHQVVKPHGGSALTVSGYVALTLENVSFYWNYNESNNVSTANAKPSPVVFIEHVVQSPGFSSFVSLTLRGCVFQNNSNGVHVSSNHDVIAKVEDSTFHDSVGHYYSSSLYIATTSSLYLNIRRCHFESNLQLQNGSVVNILSGRWSNISVVDVSFVKNRGVYLSTATNTTFDILMGVVLININHSHTSERHSRSSIRFERVNLSDNYFPNRGGGVDIRCYYGGSPSSMDVVMDNVYLKNNTGFWHGGGVTIMSTSNTLVLIRDSTFIGNKALGEISYGGAMYLSGSRTVIESCTFVNNSALTGTTLFLDEYHDTCDIKDSVLQSDLPRNATSIVHSLSGDSLRLSNSTVHATNGSSSPLTIMTREPLVPEYKPQLYIELVNGSTIVCPVKYNSVKNITMPFAHMNMFQCYMCPRNSYTLDAAQMSDHSSANETDVQCLDCPGGGYCYDGDLHARHNNWCQQVVSGNEKRYVCIACEPNTCCGELTCDNPQSCSGNREGTACSQCKEGYSLAFRLFDAITVTDKCYSNDLLSMNNYIIVLIICISLIPILILIVYFKCQKHCFCGKKDVNGVDNKENNKDNKENAGTCSKDCICTTLKTVERIGSFFYPYFFAYKVNDGMFNIFPQIKVKDINFSIFRPLSLTKNDSEAALQLLGSLSIPPAFTCFFIVLYLGWQTLKGMLAKDANRSAQGEGNTLWENTNESIQGGYGEGNDPSGNVIGVFINEKQDNQPSCLPRDIEPSEEMADTFLYICVRHYFSLWRFLYPIVFPIALNVVLPTYAESGLIRKFIDGSQSLWTNGLLIGISLLIFASLGVYPLVVMYLSYRCEECDWNGCCFRCPCNGCSQECRRSVIFFSLCILPGLPTLPFGLLMLAMSCFNYCCNCQCPAKSLMTCITTVFDNIAQEGRNGKRKINKNEQGPKNKQKNNQKTITCARFMALCHSFLLSAWEGFELFFLVIFTMVSKLTWYDQAIRIPTLISLSAVHLVLVTWIRPLRSAEANIVYVLASLVLVIVGALNAIQVGDFGTGHPLGISKEVLYGVDVVQFGLFLFPILCLIFFILYYLVLCIRNLFFKFYKYCEQKLHKCSHTNDGNSDRLSLSHVEASSPNTSDGPLEKDYRSYVSVDNQERIVI